MHWSLVETAARMQEIQTEIYDVAILYSRL
jgi:hypothetical protein